MNLPECQQPPVKACSTDAPDRPPMRGGRCLWLPHMFSSSRLDARWQEVLGLVTRTRVASAMAREPAARIFIFPSDASRDFCRAVATAVAVACAASCGTQRASPVNAHISTANVVELTCRLPTCRVQLSTLARVRHITMGKQSRRKAPASVDSVADQLTGANIGGVADGLKAATASPDVSDNADPNEALKFPKEVRGAVRVFDGIRGRGLQCTRNVKKGEVLIGIPKKWALDTQSFGGSSGQMQLAVTLQNLRKANNFRVRHLPATNDMPCFWSSAELDWLRGLHVYEPAAAQRKTLESMFADAKPTCSLDDFIFGMTNVQSRTFDGGSNVMVFLPFVDLINSDTMPDLSFDIRGSADGYINVHASKDFAEGEEALVNYAGRGSKPGLYATFLAYGYVPSAAEYPTLYPWDESTSAEELEVLLAKCTEHLQAVSQKALPESVEGGGGAGGGGAGRAGVESDDETDCGRGGGGRESTLKSCRNTGCDTNFATMLPRPICCSFACSVGMKQELSVSTACTIALPLVLGAFPFSMVTWISNEFMAFT